MYNKANLLCEYKIISIVQLKTKKKIFMIYCYVEKFELPKYQRIYNEMYNIFPENWRSIFYQRANLL